jgi:hypothetical protein
MDARIPLIREARNARWVQASLLIRGAVRETDARIPLIRVARNARRVQATLLIRGAVRETDARIRLIRGARNARRVQAPLLIRGAVRETDAPIPPVRGLLRETDAPTPRIDERFIGVQRQKCPLMNRDVELWYYCGNSARTYTVSLGDPCGRELHGSGSPSKETRSSWRSCASEIDSGKQPDFDRDFSPGHPRNLLAAASMRLRYDSRREMYVDENGCLVRDRFGQPL